MRTEPRKPRMVKVQCRECGAMRRIPDVNFELGMMLKPYPGGGNYGHCLKCKRTGTLMVIELPPPAPPILPMGWTKHPGGET